VHWVQVVALPPAENDPAEQLAQVPLLLYCPGGQVTIWFWQFAPVYPGSQRQAPVGPQVPWPLHVVVASQNTQFG
jgi:hypothetical protein